MCKKEEKITFAVGRCFSGFSFDHRLSNFLLFLSHLERALSQSKHEKFPEFHSKLPFFFASSLLFFSFLFSLFFFFNAPHTDTLTPKNGEKTFSLNLIQLCSQIASQKLTLHIVASTHFTLTLFTSKFASKESLKTRKLCNLELFSLVSHTQSLLFFLFLWEKTQRGYRKKFLSLPARQYECVLCRSFPTIHPKSKAFFREMKKHL